MKAGFNREHVYALCKIPFPTQSFPLNTAWMYKEKCTTFKIAFLTAWWCCKRDFTLTVVVELSLHNNCVEVDNMRSPSPFPYKGSENIPPVKEYGDDSILFSQQFLAAI